MQRGAGFPAGYAAMTVALFVLASAPQLNVSQMAGQAPGLSVAPGQTSLWPPPPRPTFNDSWVNITTSVHPSARFGATMVYDAKDGYVLLFGGDNSSFDKSPLNDTWIFRGGNWSQLHPLVSPSAREFALAAYDAIDGYVLLFGGYTPLASRPGTYGVTPLNDTWEFRNGSWTRLALATAPPKCAWSAATYSTGDAVYDYGLHRVRIDTTCGDLWDFSGGSWTNSTPPVRVGSVNGAMGYDVAGQALTVLGATIANLGAIPPTYSSVTYSYSNSFTNLTWTQKAAPKSLGARVFGAIQFDGSRQALLLFGGLTADYFGYAGYYGTTYPVYNDTWTYGNSVWRPLSTPTAPSARFYVQMAFDAHDRVMVLFGGVAGGTDLFSAAGQAGILCDTWEIS